MAYIYLIVNNITKKKYVGQTTVSDIRRRWKAHLSSSSTCVCLKRAFEKYGVENFTFSIIIICFDEDRFKFESDYIEKYNTVAPNGYNISSGGSSGFKNCVHSLQTKEHLGKKSMLYWSNNENVEKHRELLANTMQNINIGEKMSKSEKWNKALIEKRIGGYKGIAVIQYDEQNNRIKKYDSVYQACKDKKFNRTGMLIAIRENKLYRNFYWKLDLEASDVNIINISKNNKKVIQYDLNGNKVAEYDSIKNASTKVECSDTMIIHHLKGKYKSAGGYIWKYSDDAKTKEEITKEVIDKKIYVKKNHKLISKYDLNNILVEKYNSVKEASKACNISVRSISQCINGHKESSKGYKWKLQEM